MDTYKISNKDNKSYKYTYNKDFKCNVYKVEGQRKNNFRMPADSKTFGVTARFLVIQIRLTSSSNTTITIQLGDDACNHFNFAFSTLSCKRPSSSQMCALINLPLQKERWLNICFDLQQIAANYWPNGSFQTLDSIEISPVCFVRDIYATNNPLSSEANGTDLPKLYTYPAGIASTNVIVPDPLTLPIADKKETRKSIKDTKPKSTSRTTPAEIRLGRSPKTGVQKSLAHPKTPALPSLEVADEQDELLVEGVGTSRTVPRKPVPMSQPKKKPNSAPKEQPQYVPPKKQEESEDSDYSDDDAFGSVPANDRSKIDIKPELPVNEEEELELVYIESLNCYYCPSNQQYYELDAH